MGMIAQALIPSWILLSVTLHHRVLGEFWREFGGVDAVFNALGLVCGCVNGARKFTTHARVMFLESERAKTYMTQIWIYTARFK
jgi:hypothetical protein